MLTSIAKGAARLGQAVVLDLRSRRRAIIAVGWMQGFVALAAAFQDVTRDADAVFGAASLQMVVPLASLIAAVVAIAALTMVEVGLRLVGTAPEPSWGRAGQRISFLGRDYRCGADAARLLRYGIVVGYANLAVVTGLLPADLLAGYLML